MSIEHIVSIGKPVSLLLLLSSRFQSNGVSSSTFCYPHTIHKVQIDRCVQRTLSEYFIEKSHAHMYTQGYTIRHTAHTAHRKQPLFAVCECAHSFSHPFHTFPHRKTEHPRTEHRTGTGTHKHVSSCTQTFHSYIHVYFKALTQNHTRFAAHFRQQQQQRLQRQRQRKLKNTIFYFTRFYAMRLIILVLSTFLRQQKQQQQARATLLVRRSFARSFALREKKTQASGECLVEIYKCISFSAFASNQMGMCINIIFKKKFFLCIF